MEKQTKPSVGEIAVDAVKETAALQGSGMGYDPAIQSLDLTKNEKRRVTALLLAIQAHDKMIVKDADLYRELSSDRQRRNESPLTPASIEAIIDAAVLFDAFIEGQFQRKEEPHDEPANTTT
jgi:hypothetical protein